MIAGKHILLTGGSGFLGRHVHYELGHRPAGVYIPCRPVCDLLRRERVRTMFKEQQPQVVIHCAATVGGIGFNRQKPATLCADNLAMGLHVMEAAADFGVEKFVLIGTACSYPLHAAPPVKEFRLHDGYPEPTNAPYGIAKRTLITLLQAYRAERGLNGISLILANLYGPGDNFDDSGHVIPAIIRKVEETRESGRSVCRLWGTGNATRDLLFVRDAAQGIVKATEEYNEPEPLNLSTGQETSIRAVAEAVAGICGYYGQFAWDTEQPDGQPRRCLDATRAKDLLGWTAETPLDVGLRETVEYFWSRAICT